MNYSRTISRYENPEPPLPMFDAVQLQSLTSDVYSAFEAGCARVDDAIKELYYTANAMGCDASEVWDVYKDFEKLSDAWETQFSEQIMKPLREAVDYIERRASGDYY